MLTNQSSSIQTSSFGDNAERHSYDIMVPLSGNLGSHLFNVHFISIWGELVVSFIFSLLKEPEGEEDYLWQFCFMPSLCCHSRNVSEGFIR